jgi:hypothetical protein
MGYCYSASLCVLPTVYSVAYDGSGGIQQFHEPKIAQSEVTRWTYEESKVRFLAAASGFFFAASTLAPGKSQLCIQGILGKFSPG